MRASWATDMPATHPESVHIRQESELNLSILRRYTGLGCQSIMMGNLGWVQLIRLIYLSFLDPYCKWNIRVRVWRIPLDVNIQYNGRYQSCMYHLSESRCGDLLHS